MTALLTGREIEHAKFLADMRKPKERRRGERNGPFSWAHIIDTIVIVAIALGMAYTGFMLGRHYESRDKVISNPAAAWNQYQASRVQGH